MTDSNHMTFRQFGRSHHLRVETAGDLEHVLGLDEALWVATGAPIDAFSLDPVFLKAVDTDNNDRILCYEVKQAITWLLALLRDRSGIDEASTVLRLDAVNTDNDDGKHIHAAALKILRQLGAPEPTTISLDQIRRLKTETEDKPVSEAGVVIAEATGDPQTKQLIADIIATVGGTAHPGGKQGVDENKLNEFLQQARAYTAWYADGAIPENQKSTDIMPLGASTPEAYRCYVELREKVDQYLAQCRAVALDGRTATHIRPTDKTLETADLNSPEAIEQLLRRSPLAPARGDGILDLETGINPFYTEPVRKFRKLALEPILKDRAETLSEDNWRTVKRFFAAHQKWIDAKQGANVEKLGIDKLRAWLESNATDALGRLMAESRKTAIAMDNIRLAEKLILYQANLLLLVNNFVSFPYLYNPNDRAVFEMGTLIMDGRHFNFSVKVGNRAEHSSVAKTSSIFLVYAEISSGRNEGKYEVVVPVTSGGQGNICVGKRGVFHDIAGRELDARVVQIVENPISVKETLAAPFQRIGRLLTGKIEAMTSAAEKQLDATAQSAIGGPTAQLQPTVQGKATMAGGLLMGGGVAIAALGSAFAYITNTLKDVKPYKVGVGVLAAILAVIMPASIIALMKLRRRDLSAILEGAGWAINARMRLTLKLGRLFTRRARLPGGSRGITRWPFVVLLILIVGLEAAFLAFYVFHG